MKQHKLMKCETDIETYIIPIKNIISMKPIHSQDGEPYIKVEYYDDELCINSTIFCTEVNTYTSIIIPIFKIGMRVRNKQTGYVNTIKQITTNHYMFNNGEYVFDIEDGFSITKQNEWEEI